jgi:hypothetical protein
VDTGFAIGSILRLQVVSFVAMGLSRFMGRNKVTLNLVPPLVRGISSFQSIRQDVDIGPVRVNYTFGGPVIAKY